MKMKIKIEMEMGKKCATELNKNKMVAQKSGVSNSL